ncbi:MAG: hypothetical protein OEX22_00450 [Cyclobacteriaceae bacterium]|nr:hypothetical protein [Cyclobacteriaceae bacterium]
MKIFTISDNIISPLGSTTEANVLAIGNGQSGITKINNPELSNDFFYGAKINYDLPSIDEYTFLENLLINSIEQALSSVDVDLNRTILVLSSTKGNIEQLNDKEKGKRIKLAEMAEAINEYFHLKHSPIVVSNACISGVSAILVARNLIEMGAYDHAIVSGGDILSKFTLSGFNSLKAVSESPCKPYDIRRDGISLGEGVGTIVISNDEKLKGDKMAYSEIIGGGQSNDANHISGPSRTGAGLNLAVTKSFKASGIHANQIDYINAHGTATLYNDEMESIAFDDLGLGKAPVNSLKGYFGHTLGAAGIIESILTIRQLNANQLMKSEGFNQLGVSRKISVIEKTKKKNIDIALKTVSGFGGCNAAIIFKKA